MEYLKDDGSLDIERINQLPILDYMEAIGYLKAELSNSPVNELNDYAQKESIDFEVAIERGWVDATDLLKRERKNSRGYIMVINSDGERKQIKIEDYNRFKKFDEDNVDIRGFKYDLDRDISHGFTEANNAFRNIENSKI